MKYATKPIQHYILGMLLYYLGKYNFWQICISVDPGGGGKEGDRPLRIFRMGRDVYVRPPQVLNPILLFCIV